MPPYTLWLRGQDAIRKWLLGPGSGSIAAPACASPSFAQYRPSRSGGGYQPWALIVLELSGDRITGWNSFLDTSTLFPMFGLPPHLPA